MNPSDSPRFREDSLMDLLDSEETEAMDLHKACRLGDLRGVEAAVKSDPQQINSKDSNVISTQLGWTPLYRSIVCGHEETSSFLLYHGADPNLTNNVRFTQLSETPLHHVADNSQWDMAEVLLRHHADPNLPQNDGDTPLHHAAFRGDDRMVAMLLQAGADCNVQNYLFGQTPLHYAVDRGHTECVRLMLERDADVLLMDKARFTQLGKSAIDLAQKQEIREMLAKFQPDELVDLDMMHPIPNSHRDFSSFNQSEIEENFSRRIELRDISPVIETFGKVDSAMSSLKTSLHKGQLGSSKRSDTTLKSLSQWLEKRNLTDLFDALVSAGYDDIDALVEQMHSPLPLTEDSLRDIGVKKPGHRARFIMYLEEEAGLIPKRQGRKQPGSSTTATFLTCCAPPSNTTFGAMHQAPLKDWLQQIKLEGLFANFQESGYDDLEALVVQMTWRRPVTDALLEREMGIEKPGYRSRILSKLQEEAQICTRVTQQPAHVRADSSPQVSIDSSGKFVACDYCSVI